MSQFIESIRFEDGQYHLLEYHQDRINRVFSEFYNVSPGFHLDQILDFSLKKTGVYKCRLLYDMENYEVDYLAYSTKKISSLKIVENNQIDYSFKFEDRKLLNSLFSLKEDCDDILIVKDSSVTDSSYANILFEREGKWYTSDTPLLKGVQRQFLIETGRINETRIKLEDLSDYTSFIICNAMLPFDEGRKVGVEGIVY